MSSRRLLLLIQRLPEDGAFKSACRDYDWRIDAHLTTGVWNEIKALRGDLWAFLGQESFTYKPVLPPSAVAEQEAKAQLMRDMHDDVVAQLRGG
jgi:hypothetical protein